MSNLEKIRGGFTLAEVLITLGIVGIIAAMTLPTLIQKYQEKQTVIALKKFYSTMEQAFISAKAEGAEPEDWATEKTADGYGSEEFISHMKPYLKILEDCSYDKDGCIQSGGYKSISGVAGSDTSKANLGHSKFILNNGEVVSFFLNDAKCKYKTATAGSTKELKNICGGLHVDINGQKAPNVAGRDFFLFYITKYGIIPVGAQADNTEYKFPDRCNRTNKTSYYSSTACTAWVIYNENMDYLHCDDLSWTGKHSCK